MTKREHLLVCLAEKCSEVQRAVAKALRFGLLDMCPENNKLAHENITLEVADLISVFELLKSDGAVQDFSTKMIVDKHIKLKKYMEYSKSIGTLE